jgi:uncharacterized double-CXXCG motif protein
VNYYGLRADPASRHTSSINAAHKWGLPGTHCPSCKTTWASTGHDYPAVDLSPLDAHTTFERPRLEKNFAEFTRLRELVRPLFPPGAPLYPGMMWGPLTGTASGTFGSFFFQNPWTLLVRREVAEQLQAAGLQGLNPCRHELRFRQKQPPDIQEFQIEPRGRLHPDCIPPEERAPCETCGRLGFSRPENLLLEKESLPPQVDLFRVANFSTLLVGTERFVETVQRLGLDGVSFQELPLR